MSEVRGQRSENREPQNIEYRMLNIEGKKLHHWKFLVRYSIFKTVGSASVPTYERRALRPALLLNL